MVGSTLRAAQARRGIHLEHLSPEAGPSTAPSALANQAQSIPARSANSPIRAVQFLNAALKVVVLLAYFWVWFYVYDRVNTYVCDPVRTIHLTTPHQLIRQLIQPYTAIIYVFGGALMPAIPFAYRRSWTGIRFVLCCYTVSSLLAFVCYLAWPLSMNRPVFEGENFGERLMLWVFAYDKPGNCFPSSHVFFAVLGAILVPRARSGRVARGAIWALAVAVCISTVTSGQHYLIDIPAGVVAALVGYAATRLLTSPG